MTQISCEELRKTLQYNPDLGVFVWAVKRKGTKGIWKEAGSVNSRGYWSITLGGKNYLMHRLAWLYSYGEFPKEFIDHKNGNPSDNRLSNLREATQGDNQKNRAMNSNNTSGYRGVCFNRVKGKWQASISTPSVRRTIGYFDSAKEAGLAYEEAAKILHGEFYRDLYETD